MDDRYGPCPVCGSNLFLTISSPIPVPYENGNGICSRCYHEEKKKKRRPYVGVLAGPPIVIAEIIINHDDARFRVEG